MGIFGKQNKTEDLNPRTEDGYLDLENGSIQNEINTQLVKNDYKLWLQQLSSSEYQWEVKRGVATKICLEELVKVLSFRYRMTEEEIMEIINAFQVENSKQRKGKRYIES